VPYPYFKKKDTAEKKSNGGRFRETACLASGEPSQNVCLQSNDESKSIFAVTTLLWAL